MKQILPLLFCTACILQEAYAENFVGVTVLEKQKLQEASFMGATELKEITAKSLSILGPLHFTHLKVEKGTKIFGPVANSEFGDFDSLIITGLFAARNVTCSKLEVIGPVDVTHLQVSGITTIIGPLTAEKSTFQNLIITADKIVLEDSKTQEIIIKKNENKKQVLNLKGNTIVQGNITFESGKGTIKQGPEVTIQGAIKGATVEKK